MNRDKDALHRCEDAHLDPPDETAACSVCDLHVATRSDAITYCDKCDEWYCEEHFDGHECDEGSEDVK